MTESSEHQRWAIVGGGFLGMTLAHKLAQEGKEVTIFEGAPHLGGLASPWELGDVVWDRHYHVTLLSDTTLRGLLAELGLEKEMQWVETRTGFYTDGKLYSMSNTVEFLRFPPLRLTDKLRLGATIFYASRLKNWRKLETILVADWLRRLSGRRTCERIWLPLLRSKLGENYKQTSAAFIWTTIARMYAARRSGLKKEMFGYVPGGYSRIIDSFSQRLRDQGVRVELECGIKKVSATNGSVRIERSDGEIEEFDQMILTVPSPVAAEICTTLTAEEKSRLSDVQYQGIICASLLLKKPLANFYVTNITDSNIPFTAVIEMSALVDPKQFGGRSLVYLPKYLAPDDPVFDQTDQQIEERFISAIARMYPAFDRDDVLSFRVSRVRHVFPIPTLNYSQKLPAVETSIPGVHILNSSHIVNGTLNVNETVQLAERAAAKLLAQQVPSPSFAVG
jgi:protoporphyrinogen oxidase